MKKAPYAALILTIVSALLLSSCCQPFAIPLPEETPQDEYLIDNLPGLIDQPLELDKEKLDILVEDIKEGKYGKQHSLIIIHYDSLVLEEYFMGWTRHMRHPLYSVTKSFSSALIGIGIEQGYIDSVDQKLLDFFPEYDNFKNMDARKESITLENVLTMTPGFKWSDIRGHDECGYPNLESDPLKMVYSLDWIKYVLDKPVSDEPGTKFLYNDGASHLLSGILTNKTGQSAEDFAEENLFEGLGITNWEWKKNRSGFTTTGGMLGGLHIHPANMAMFGYLYFKKGALDGKQIVPQNWVKESTSAHIERIDPESGEIVGYYGYQWWCNANNNTYFAFGFAGQSIFVIPGLNMIVAMGSVLSNQSMYHKYGVKGVSWDDGIKRYIIDFEEIDYVNGGQYLALVTPHASFTYTEKYYANTSSVVGGDLVVSISDSSGNLVQGNGFSFVVFEMP